MLGVWLWYLLPWMYSQRPHIHMYLSCITTIVWVHHQFLCLLLWHRDQDPFVHLLPPLYLPPMGPKCSMLVRLDTAVLLATLVLFVRPNLHQPSTLLAKQPAAQLLVLMLGKMPKQTHQDAWRSFFTYVCDACLKNTAGKRRAKIGWMLIVMTVPRDTHRIS